MFDISHISRRLLGTIFAWLFAASIALAQGASTASIAGTVRDSSGSVLPGVTVTSTQTDTGLTRTVVSDEAGRYTVSNLPVGPYQARVHAAGLPHIRANRARVTGQRESHPQRGSRARQRRGISHGAGTVAADRDAERRHRHGRGQSARPRVAAQRTRDVGSCFHDRHGGLGRNTGRRARRGHFHIARHHRRGRRPAERHRLHARRRDAQRPVQRLVDAVAVSGGAAGIQGRDQRPAGAVRASLGRRRQRGDQVRDEHRSPAPSSSSSATTR